MHSNTTTSSESPTPVNNQPSLESLENRQLRSASPLNFGGHYVNNASTGEIDVDLSHSGSKYTGDISLQGQQFSIKATERHNALSGVVQDSSGGSHTFKATLKGKNLSVLVDNIVTRFHKQAANPNALVMHNGSQFQFAAPKSWQSHESSAGIAISSADHSMEADVLAGTFNGTYTPHDIVATAQQAGATVLLEQAMPTVMLNGMPEQKEEVLLSVKGANGKMFASGLIIGTTSAGGHTHMMMESVRAPKSGFAKNLTLLDKVVTSVRSMGNAASAGHVHSGKVGDTNWWNDYYGYGDYSYVTGFYAPSVYGDWGYQSDPYWGYTASDSYISDASASFDASASSFDSSITSIL